MVRARPLARKLLFPALLLAAGSVRAQNLDQIHYRWRNDYGRELAVPNGTIQVSGTTSIQTTSTSYTPVNQMLVSPGVAGDFLVFFTASIEASLDNSTQRFSIFVDGTQVTHSEREVLTESSIPDTPFNVVTHAFLPGLTPGQVVSVQWRTTGGTVTMRGRTLTLSQVSAADVTQVTATSNTTTSSATDVLVNSMTMSPGAGNYLVWFSTSVKGDNDDVETYVSLYHNGVQVPHTERLVDQEESLAGNTYFPVGTHALLTGVGAGDTIEARWRRSPSSSSTMLERTLTAYRINPAEAFQATDTVDTTTTSTTFNQVAGMTLTPGAGNYHVWFSSSLEGTSGGQVMEAALYVNGVQVPHTLRNFLVENSFTDTFQSQPVAFQAFVTGVGATDVIEVRWRRTGGGTATMHERTLAVWRDTPGAPQAWWTTPEDTKLTGVPKNTTQRLRFEVAKASGGGVTATYQLQVSEGANCAAGVYTAVPTGSTGHWRIMDSIWINDGEATVNVTPGLTDEAGTFVAGQLKDAGNTTGSITLSANRFTEIEFAIQATANAFYGQDYCFRLFDTTGGVPLNAYTVYGQAQLEGGTIFLANHDAGQQTDKFTTTTPVTSELFAFKLSTIGTVTVDNVRVLFSTGGGVVNADVTGGELWLDANNDGVINGGDSMIQGGVSGSGGRLTFTNNFTPNPSGSNYLVRATVANLVGDDTTSFDLGLGELDELGSPITESGSVNGATHTQDKTLILTNHTLGQIGDQFTVPSPVTADVFRFNLARSGVINVDTLRVSFTTGGGVANGDVTAGELWRDANNDGIINGGDVAVQTGVTPVGGVLTFTTNFQPAAAGTNYLVRVTTANLVADDTTTFTLGLLDIDPVEAGVFETGSTTGATHTQDKTLALANHDAGQTADKFLTATPVTDVLYAFKLTGTVTVDTLRLNFTTGLGVSNGDVTAGELWRDVNNDGIIDGGDSSIQTGVTPVGGVMTFTANFFSGVNNYLVRATVASLAGGDTTTFSLGLADIDEVEASVGESGSATNAVHVHDGAGGTKDVYYSVGTSAADLKTGAPTIAITAGTATLSVAQTGNVGVGDVIDFGGGTKVYVFAVTSATQFEVRTATGTVPANAAATPVTSIRRTFNDWQTASTSSGTASYLGTFDLVAADSRVAWVGYKDGPFNVSATIVVDGYNTDATRFLKLTAADASHVVSGVTQRHFGVAGAGVLLETQAGPANVLRVNDAYTRVEWLEIDGNGQPANGVLDDAGGSDGTFELLLVHNLGGTGFQANTSGSELRNSILYDNGNDGVHLNGAGLELYNCTVFQSGGDGVEVAAGATATVENVIAVGSGTGNFRNDGTMTTNNNLASDGTATAPAGAGAELGNAGNLDNVSPTDVASPGPGFVIFQSIAGRDLHLRSDPDNTAVDAGKDLSSQFTLDIDGSSRFTPWDIGADDVRATTAVKLVAFEAQGYDGVVEVRWETGSEIRNLGFHLHRARSPRGPYERVTPSVIPGLGSSPAGAQYRYHDEDVVNGTTYYYQLEDIETTGRTEMHGPVAATPAAGKVLAKEPAAGSYRITYGRPGENRIRVLETKRNGVVIELVTEGFYAVPREDGALALEIPGFDALAEEGAPSLPVKHQWIDAVAGRKVELRSVQGGLQVVTGAWSVSSELPELEAKPSGTVKARRGRAATPRGKGLLPAEAARVVTVAFQGVSKKAMLELAPLRWAAETNELYLSRRLVVELSFQQVEPSEVSFGETRGRRRARKIDTNDGVVARLAVRERGLYRVRYEDVFGSRRNPAADSVRLTRGGEDVPFHVEPRDGSFRPGSILYFVTEGAALNPYGAEAVYELSLSSDDHPGTRMDVVAAPPSGPDAAFYWKRVEREENRYYQAALLDAADLWFWEPVLAPATKGFPFTVSSLAPASESGRLEVWLHGASDTPASPDHHLRVYLNRSIVSDLSWNGKAPRHVSVDVPPGILLEGENLLELENVGDTGASYSMVMVDRFALEYPRLLVAEDGVLEGSFRQGGTAAVTSVGSGAHVLSIGGEEPRWLRSGPRFAVEAGESYLVVDPAAVRAPEVRQPRTASLRSRTRQADYVVLGPRAFVEAAAPLLAHRSSQGLASLGVAIEDVFDEFGFGESNPEAVRSFLEHAYHEWEAPSLRYVVLLGDGSYDYKDHSKLGKTNPVPPLMVKTSYLWTASDPALAALNGEDLLPDVAIGRIPAESAGEVASAVAKILAWESSPHRLEGRVVLVADDPDAGGNFVADAEAAAARLPAGTDVTRIYLSELGAAEASRSIAGSFDRGASLVSYVGHGGIHLWADESLFHTGQVASLAPQEHQPLVLTMNCLNGYFHFPHFGSLAEELVMAKDKGAIAAFSPSGLSLNEPAQRFHLALLNELYSGRHLRLGDAVLGAQEAYIATGALPELLSIYHLFGDPALTLR